MEICEETGKQIYHTKADAYKTLAPFSKRYSGGGLRVYQCPFCKQFHLTHQKARGTKRKWKK